MPTQEAGGAAGAGFLPGSPGELGIGGGTNAALHSGTGGGGYYGGGGGGQDGHGGGGSSYIGGVNAGMTTPGVRNGNGVATISWGI